MSDITPGFIKRAPVAWFASHRHGADGANEPYAYSYLFAYTIDLPAGAKALALPNNERIRILAITVANEVGEVRPAQPLYDTGALRTEIQNSYTGFTRFTRWSKRGGGLV